ncbi:monocarboxylate permease [Pluteus cervinus]|uniref:Monocarboxylate permease n=1 Tax=Pluteus cervinus TaxID=181527 RepID=A0ACD3BBV1_9AGAR|nr:monocarboxylate permease [Pluteus cervinus]
MPTFPEGGSQGWLTLAGAYTNAFGVYQDYYVRVYLSHSGPSAIGWIGGVQIFLIFSLGLGTGLAFDRGYFFFLTSGVLVFMLSLSHENQYYQVFLAQGICLGLSCGLSYIPSLAVVSHYFHRQRPLAMGIVASGSALGAVLHPIMLNHLFNGPVGFKNGVRISAGLNSFLLIIANLIMRTRLPPKKSASRLPILQFARDPPYVITVIAGLFVFCGLFFPVFYLQLDAITHGVDRNFAFYALSVLNAASIFGRTLPTLFAPKLGIFNVLAITTVGTGIVILSLAAVKDEAGTAIFAIFYGFFSGACIGLTPPALATLSRDMNEIGARIGINFGFCGILGLFATPIAGALLTTQFHWVRPILFSGITMVVAGLLLGVSRTLLAKRKGFQVV